MKDVFKEQANKWDSERRISRSREVSQIIESFLEDRKYSSAMEFGAGTGLISFNMLDLFEEILLVDISEAMLNVANEKIELNNLSNVSTMNINLNEETISKKFDVIYSSLALHHVEDYKNVISVLKNHLSEDGQLILIDLDDKNEMFHSRKNIEKEHSKAHFDGFNEKEMCDYFEEIGFKNVVSKGRAIESEVGGLSLICISAKV